MTFDSVTDTGGALDLMRNIPKLEFVRGCVDGMDVLNVGCWTGAFESLIAGTAASVTAVDVEEQALEVARKRVPTATLVKASVLELPFEDASFDVVTLWETIEHIPPGTEITALKEIARVLRPGGRLALSTPSGRALSRILDPAWLVAGHRHYGIDRMTALLRQAGFAVERAEVLGGMMVVADYMALYIWKWIFRRPMPLWPRFRGAFLRSASRKGFVGLFALSVRIPS